jgi:hypothetical protein
MWFLRWVGGGGVGGGTGGTSNQVCTAEIIHLWKYLTDVISILYLHVSAGSLTQASTLAKSYSNSLLKRYSESLHGCPRGQSMRLLHVD